MIRGAPAGTKKRGRTVYPVAAGGTETIADTRRLLACRAGRILRALAGVVLAAGCASGPGFVAPGILYVPTPEAVGVEMLRFAGVTAGDVVYDLGSGDGRLVVAAAQEFRARGVGVEIEARLVQDSRERALRAGVADRASFTWGDLFAADLAPATVVTLYLGEALNRRLVPKLLSELRPGARVVSHDFGMGDWRPDRTVLARGPDRDHLLQLWVVPADIGGAWRVRLDGGGAREATLVLRQRFQELDGTLSLDGTAHPVAGVVDGETLRFTAGVLAFAGRLRDQRLEGEARGPGGTRGWTAERP
jgi:SAM-dependent methyltransferase